MVKGHFEGVPFSRTARTQGPTGEIDETLAELVREAEKDSGKKKAQEKIPAEKKKTTA